MLTGSYKSSSNANHAQRIWEWSLLQGVWCEHRPEHGLPQPYLVAGMAGTRKVHVLLVKGVQCRRPGTGAGKSLRGCCQPPVGTRLGLRGWVGQCEWGLLLGLLVTVMGLTSIQ